MSKKRTSIYFAEEDRHMLSFLRAKYGLDSDASVVRFLIRKAAKEEGYVPGAPGEHRQDSTTR